MEQTRCLIVTSVLKLEQQTILKTEPRGGQNVGSIPNNWVFHSGSNSGVGTAVSQFID